MAALIGGQAMLSSDAKDAAPENEFALIRDNSVSLASDEGEESGVSMADYPLLLGKDGTVLDTATTEATLKIVESENFSYEY